ncbi:MAG: aminotransferase class IV [Deltaproteobacteria bacterium]|nr:aminotransferase class IV [Deltaproteobacteria bacterium]MBW2417061.1 aminotransferase class IV [Deltaproteobacteria bacterium]
MSPRLSEHWLDGRLVPAGEAPAAGDPRQARDPGCYTTARVRAGTARHAAAHARRLARDALALGIGEIPADTLPELFSTLGRHAFGAGEGVIRVEARAGAGGAAQLRGVPRDLGPGQATWTACIAPFPHGGPSPWPGAKLLGEELYERARALAQREEVDEVLLLDDAGSLVEGARSNLLVIDAEGQLWTPDLTLGAVAGIALAAIRGGFPELRTRKLRGERLGELREIIAVNAVRGARAIVSLDGHRVGTGEPGSWARQLDDFLSRA